MDKEELQVAAFEIILHSGEARTAVHDAFASMREGDYQKASEQLEVANTSLLEAHHAQTKLLQDYAKGVEMTMEIIMVHAQDHLMTTMTLKEVAIEMMHLYQKVDSK